MIPNTEERKQVSASKGKIKDIIYSLKAISFVEHLFGLWRFRAQGDSLLPTSWKQKLYGVSVAIIHIGMFVGFNIINNNLDDLKVVGVFYMVPCFVILLQFVLTMIFNTLIFNKTNRQLCVTFADLDARLKTNDEFYQRAATKSKKWLSILVVTHLACCILDVLTDYPPDPRDLVFIPMFLEQKIENIIFCLVIEMLTSRLEIINNYIKNFLEDKDETAPVYSISDKNGVTTRNMIGRPSEDNMKISDLAMMYDTIGSICAMINSLFNFQVFMSLVSTFCYIVMTIWTSLYFYKTPEDHYGALLAIIIWCVTTLVMVGTMCLVCERLLATRRSSRVLVNQLVMDYSLPRTMRVQAKAFMELIEAWPLRILIYDMFSVDISLMLKFISVSTTYLIVIIQVSHFN